MLQRERDEILSADGHTINSLSAYIDELISENAVCTIGNALKLEDCADEFLTVRDLF